MEQGPDSRIAHVVATCTRRETFGHGLRDAVMDR
jgi:hypothetical protein